jgi:hypothetical protein
MQLKTLKSSLILKNQRNFVLAQKIMKLVSNLKMKPDYETSTQFNSYPVCQQKSVII